MKRKFITVLCVLQLIFFYKAISQNVSINTTGTAADASSMLDITATDKGLLIPRMTQAQRTAIAIPADALLVYQTDGAKGFYFYNSTGSVWTLLAANGSSISSLNGLTTATQTFATPGTSGTAPNWISSGSAHTLHIPFASAAGVTGGLLSNTDWTTFNNKLSTIDTGNIANFYFKVRGLHSAGSGIGYNNVTGAISNTGVLSLNGATGNISFAMGNLTETGSSVLTITGGSGAVLGAGAALQVKQATTAQSGFLSSADWNTFNNKAGTTNTWLTTGNSGTTPGTNYLGTTDNKSLVFKTSGTQAMTINTNQGVGIGPSPAFQPAVNNRELLLVDAGTTSSTNVISAKGTIDSYLQLNIQNKSATSSASSDIVATADNGDETTNYVDMGINSSAYSGGYFGNANDAYLYNIGQNFLIGTGSANTSVVFMTGGSSQSTNERMRIDGNGNVGIGTASPSTKLHVVGANPLTLLGVAAGTNTAADSLLTITSGLVRKLPLSTFATASSAIASLNGLTPTTQTFATGTGGTNFAISSAGSVHTFNLPDASATARGVITTGAQTIAGSKTFSSAPLFSSLTAGSVPFAGTGGLLSENNAKLFWDAANSRVGIGTNTPSADLTLYQTSGTTNTRGLRFTGNSIGGTSSGTGFSMALGYNSTGNKQLWLGDADYVGNSTGSFLRYGVNGTNFPVLDAIAGDNSNRRYLALGVAGDVNSGVIFGSDASSTNPGSQVWDNGNMAIGNSYRSNAAPSNGLLVQGNVGIGTTSPNSKLDVGGDISADNSIFVDASQSNTGSSKTPGLFLGGPSSGEVITSKRTSGTNQYGIDFYTSSNLRMSLTNGGSLGISTTTPTSSLDVNGSVSLPIVTTSSSLTLGSAHHTVIINSGSTPTISLPAASTCSGRMYIIVNRSSGSRSIGAYTYYSYSSTSASTVSANSSITLQSDGTNWYQVQ